MCSRFQCWGPLLFIIYINDMPQFGTKFICKLYSDDTLLDMDITKCGLEQLKANVANLYDRSVDFTKKSKQTRINLTK